MDNGQISETQKYELGTRKNYVYDQDRMMVELARV